MSVQEPPVVPDADTARRWAEEELAKSEYQQGGGNWLMDAIERILDALQRAAEGTAGALGTSGTVVAVVVSVLAVAVIVWLVVGPLRRNRAAARAGELFEDDRAAQALADDAMRSASRGDWAHATAELYRALIRLLSERDVIVLTPGVTAHEAAVSAGLAVPDLSDRLVRDADAFDRIRYGDGRADESDFIHVRATYDQARTARRSVAASGASA